MSRTNMIGCLSEPENHLAVSLDMKLDSIVEIVTELRYKLHRYPELSMHEVQTKEILMTFLKEHTSARICDYGNWFCCVFGEEEPEGPIALRADIDALPIDEGESISYHSLHSGISHKCGHDGHAACLCGLALVLETHPVSRPVWLIFQPGEETGSGGRMCADFVRKQKIREIYAFHNLGGYPENSIVVREGLTQPASEGLRLTFQGKCSHASAPESGINPAETIARLILYTQDATQDTCRECPQGMVLCSIVGVKIGNGDFGICAGEGELSMTLRAENESDMKKLEQQILDFAAEEAKRNGLTVSHQISDYFPETRNTGHGFSRVCQAAADSGKQLILMKDLWRASEDFGYYTKVADGAMFYIGTGENRSALHTEEYDFNDQIIGTAIEMFCRLVK